MLLRHWRHTIYSLLPRATTCTAAAALRCRPGPSNISTSSCCCIDATRVEIERAVLQRERSGVDAVVVVRLRVR